MSGGSICDRRRGLFGVGVLGYGPQDRPRKWTPVTRPVRGGVVARCGPVVGRNAARLVALTRIRRPRPPQAAHRSARLSRSR